MQIVSSRNLFLDSSKNIHGTSDDFKLQLNEHGIVAGDGQQIRLSLVQFSMYNNLYNVNPSNNSFHVRTTTNLGTLEDRLQIPSGNYPTVASIMHAFAEALADNLLLHARIATVNAGLTVTVGGPTFSSQPYPLDNETFENGNRIIRFKMTFSANHNISDCRVGCLPDNQDSYALFGVDLIDEITVNSDMSFNVIRNSSTEISVYGKYPMQLSTSSQIYLRTDCQNSNIEMPGFANSDTSDVLSSNILGVIQMDSEFCHYESAHNEFFITLSNKQLNTIRFYLTDKRNRKLPLANSSYEQNKTGNFFYTAIIRIDILQVTHPHYLETVPRPLPDYKKQNNFNMLMPPL